MAKNVASRFRAWKVELHPKGFQENKWFAMTEAPSPGRFSREEKRYGPDKWWKFNEIVLEM